MTLWEQAQQMGQAPQIAREAMPGVVGLAIGGLSLSIWHDILATGLVIASLCYLAWKWHRDWKRNRAHEVKEISQQRKINTLEGRPPECDT